MATAKLLYRRLDALFGGLKTRRPQPKLVEAFLEDCFGSLRDDLRLKAGLLFAERRDGFVLVKTVGEPGHARSPRPSTPRSSPLAEVVRHRVYVFSDPDAENSPHRLGLLDRAATAALVVGQRPLRFAFFFLLAEGWQLEELDFALNTIRAALDARLVDARVRGSFREAAEIQQLAAGRGAAGVPGLPARGPLGGRRGGRRRLLRLPRPRRRHPRPLDRRRQRPRPAGRAARARRGHRPAHGDREGAEGRPRLREAEPRDPPLAAVEPLRERVLRRAGAGRPASST